MKKKRFYLIPLGILAAVVFVSIGGLLVMQLWNWLLPGLFSWPRIGFWQAVGLLALCRILFGGFGCHGPSRPGFRRRMAERCEWMTPEERERFREGLRRHGKFGPLPGESQEP